LEQVLDIFRFAQAAANLDQFFEALRSVAGGRRHSVFDSQKEKDLRS
jgi:hypothetical protein